MGFRLIHESDCRPRKTVLFASSLTLLLWMDLLIQGYMLGYRSAIVMVGLFFMAAPLVKAPRNADSGTAEMVAFRISMLVVASISSIRAVAGLLDPVRDAFLSSSLDAWLILVLDLSTLMAFGLAAIPPARGRAPTDAMKAADRGTLETVPGRVSLSPRESEYVHEIIMGSSPKEIAGAHGVSHSTVRNTLSRAYKKLGVRDCGELLVLGSGIRARR
jgi:DNA-binding CsgD family transcriptional regulator